MGGSDFLLVLACPIASEHISRVTLMAAGLIGGVQNFKVGILQLGSFNAWRYCVIASKLAEEGLSTSSRLPTTIPPFFALKQGADHRCLQDLCYLLTSVCLSNATRGGRYDGIGGFSFSLGGASFMVTRRLNMHR